MSLSPTAINILGQLADLVHQLKEPDYSRSSPVLSGSTIGQHVRHTLEFFVAFEVGHRRGVINYDERQHDKLIETEKAPALNAIRGTIAFISGLGENKELTLEVGYDLVRDEYISVETNTWRELVYNIEHAVHHMAIIKIGVCEMASYVSLPPDFGIAASTIRYNNMAGAAASGSLL